MRADPDRVAQLGADVLRRGGPDDGFTVGPRRVAADELEVDGTHERPCIGRMVKAGTPTPLMGTSCRSMDAMAPPVARRTVAANPALMPVVVTSCSGGVMVTSHVTPARSGWASASCSPWSIVSAPTTPSTPTTAPMSAGATGMLVRPLPRSNAIVAPRPMESGAHRRTRVISVRGCKVSSLGRGELARAATSSVPASTRTSVSATPDRSRSSRCGCRRPDRCDG